NEPFTDVAFVGICALGQFGGRCRSAVSERLVESQLLSEVNQRGTERRAKVANDFTQKRVHPLFVDCSLWYCCRHDGPPDLSVELFPGGGSSSVFLRQLAEQVKRSSVKHRETKVGKVARSSDSMTPLSSIL